MKQATPIGVVRKFVSFMFSIFIFDLKPKAGVPNSDQSLKTIAIIGILKMYKAKLYGAFFL